MYGAAFKPHCRRAENEVCRAFDVAILEVNAGIANACINGVLVAEEAAADEYKSVALGVQGYGLAEFRGVVLDGDVLECDVAAFNLYRVRAERAHGLVCPSEADVGMVVVGYNGLVGTFTSNLYICKP